MASEPTSEHGEAPTRSGPAAPRRVDGEADGSLIPQADDGSYSYATPRDARSTEYWTITFKL